ncbi:MAG: SUMF1/EgtB/PvdO family nonheme iron enzyme [Deltaproteobacteria bacterium]|nr:SUMF1/EgtB/PvdO family nonheme iron enzyme [Deltaproteobacteria bacterium]
MKKLVLTAVCAVLLGAPASAVTIDWVTVGDPGNACDVQFNRCFGAVARTYRVSKTEVTNTQYVEFLNAADPTGANMLALYSASMGSDATFGGINFVGGNPNGSKYVVKSGFASKPVNYVSVYDSFRFANWLHNGQGSGDTETGAYTLLGGTPNPSNGLTVTRNAGATIFLTTEDEWYKAAYYDPISTSYFRYPAGSSAQTACAAPGATANTANCNGVVGELTDVGSYTGSASPNGTFDQGGNVDEWSETIIGINGRVFRGGSFDFGHPLILSKTIQGNAFPTGSNDSFGFRVAALPEPGSGLLLTTGMLGLAAWRGHNA